MNKEKQKKNNGRTVSKTYIWFSPFVGVYPSRTFPRVDFPVPVVPINTIVFFGRVSMDDVAIFWALKIKPTFLANPEKTKNQYLLESQSFNSTVSNPTKNLGLHRVFWPWIWFVRCQK